MKLPSPVSIPKFTISSILALTLAPHFDDAAGFDDRRLEEPGEAETDEYVEHVAADRIGHRHVAVALSAMGKDTCH